MQDTLRPNNRTFRNIGPKFGRTIFVFLFSTLISMLAFPANAFSVNLHLIDSADNGFQLFRSGYPTDEDFDEWCRLGISEILILSERLSPAEKAYQTRCPSIKVINALLQDAKTPVSRSFLDKFDKWVQGARKHGKKILFRCECGCHRTGRLAAYYEMRYMNRPFDDALANLYRYGKHMHDFKYLKEQIQALQDFKNSTPCRFSDMKLEKNYCVQED